MYTVAPSCHYDHPHRVSAQDQQYYEKTTTDRMVNSKSVTI